MSSSLVCRAHYIYLAFMKLTMLLGLLFAGGMAISVIPQERERAKIPDKFKWNLADIYPSEEAWRAAKEKAATEILSMQQFRGKVTSSASLLADTLDRQYALDKEVSRLFTYA